MARGAAANVFSAGHHGSTYGGNPLACAAAQAVIDSIVQDGLCARASELGAIVRETVTASVRDPGSIREFRSRGLMLGIELQRDCGELVGQALEAGLLINVTAGSTIRLLPPLVMSDDQARELGTGIARLIDNFHG
jgi:acetylornithine aminotransferase